MSELVATAAVLVFAVQYLVRRILEVLLMAGFGFAIVSGIAFFLWFARTFLAA